MSQSAVCSALTYFGLGGWQVRPLASARLLTLPEFLRALFWHGGGCQSFLTLAAPADANRGNASLHRHVCFRDRSDDDSAAAAGESGRHAATADTVSAGQRRSKHHADKPGDHGREVSGDKFPAKASFGLRSLSWSPKLACQLPFFEALVIHSGRSFVRIMRLQKRPGTDEAAVMTYGVGYLVALITMVVIDLAWLSVMAPRFYRPILGDIGLADVNISPAIAFYLLYPIGVVIFAVSPALKDGSFGTALLYGALFGFFTYATYDLTNHATLRNWTTQLTLVDVAWGTILVSVTSAVTFWAASRYSGG